MLYSTNISTTHPPHTPLSTTRLPNTQSPRTTTKKKIILYLGFQGLKYCGWQRNPNVWTVEDALQKALFDAGFISDVNMASLSKVSWAAAARTDRGVSAAAQIASLKVEWPKTYDFDPVTFVDQLRVHLPSDIVVYGAQQVVSSMNARTACNARSYEYLVPFDIVDEFSLVTKNRSIEQIRTELDCILAHFVGTHSFHNFTRPTRIGEAGLKRYIISFTTHPSLIEIGSRSFIRVKVDGQSFVLHQIRKMVSIALLVLLGWIESAEQQIAMDPKIRRNVPPVPAAGLCLDNLFYDYFNTRFVGRGNLEKEVSFDYYRSEKEDFKRKFIYSNPAVQELLVDETRTFLNGLKHNLCEDYFLDKAANALVPSQAFIQEIWKKELNETVDLTSVREEREDDLESD